MTIAPAPSGPSAGPEIILVVAVAANGVIGHDNRMPWHIPADLRHFRRLTMGRPVVMGRRTFEAIGKPLDGRHNIVLTRNPGWQAAGVTVVPGLGEALAAAGPDAEAVMVIGGANVYAQAMGLATRIELTEVALSPEGDARFPPIDPAVWQEVARTEQAGDGSVPAIRFVRLQRR
jgi:dihydrofolate reductase